MYHLMSIGTHSLYLVRMQDGQPKAVAEFPNFVDEPHDTRVLADEMVEVLNAELAARPVPMSPENREPDYSVPAGARDVCGDPSCGCGGVEDPTDPASVPVYAMDQTGLPHHEGCLCIECDPPIKDSPEIASVKDLED